MFGGKIQEIYEKYGLKCVYPPIYLLFFLFNFLSSFGMNYPATDPNELGVIAVAHFFTGKSWAGIMVSVNYYYGFLQGLLYTPAVLIFRDPAAQYTAIAAINALLISLIPLLAISISKRLGITVFWKMAVIAFISGGYCCYFAHSKFAWSETVTILIPWVVLRLILGLAEQKKKAKAHFMSVLTGILCGIAYGAHVRLVYLPLIVIVIMIFERIVYGKKSVLLPSFIPSLILSLGGTLWITHILQTKLWMSGDPAQLNNTLSNLLSNIDGSAESGERFVQTLFGQLYYFITSTWGFGALSLCLFGAVMISTIKKKAAKEPQSYSMGITTLSLFAFLTSVMTIIAGTLYRFNADGYYNYQDNVIFGRFLDSVIPFSLVFVMAVLFTTSVKLNKIVGAAAICSLIYLVFFSVTAPVILECSSTRIAPILALYPLRIGAAGAELLNFTSLTLTVSAVFCVLAVFVVVISCTKKNRSIIISVIISGLTVYSLLFISGTYLPMCREESVAKNQAVVNLSESVYNQSGAPALTLYNLSRHDALMLRYLNDEVNVRITYDIETIPENCFVAVKSDEDVSALLNSRTPFLLVSENEKLKLYAYGERAVAYMRSQNVGDEAPEDEPLITTTAETTPPIETTVTTTSRTSFTTERTPIISTYIPPEVVTAHEDELGEEDECVVIE